MRSSRSGIVGAAMAAFVLLGGTAQAEVRGVVVPCPGGKLCPWFQPVLATPTGWSRDDAASDANHLAILVPAGTTFDRAPARIYGRAYVNAEKTGIEERARISSERWKQANPSASAERLPDVARANGKASFQLYRYRNPGRRQQPVELTAFGEDIDEHGTRFGVLIVLTATSEAQLKGSEAAYRAVLGGF